MWSSCMLWNSTFLSDLSNYTFRIVKIIFNPFGAGIDFSRQNLTSTDVRFWRLKSIPALKELKFYIGIWPIAYSIQMKRKKLTKTCMMISNWKNPLVFMVVQTYFSAVIVNDSKIYKLHNLAVKGFVYVGMSCVCGTLCGNCSFFCWYASFSDTHCWDLPLSVGMPWFSWTLCQFICLCVWLVTWPISDCHLILVPRDNHIVRGRTPPPPPSQKGHTPPPPSGYTAEPQLFSLRHLTFSHLSLKS